MKVEPSFESFAAGYGAGRPSVVYTRLVADLETPVSAMLKLADGKANSFLLESVEGGAVRGRYSLIGLKPDLVWRCTGDRPEINRQFRVDERAFRPCTGGGLASLRALVGECRIELPAGLPPMTAGLFGYMGYDMVRLMEDLPTDRSPGLGLPDSVFLRPTVMAIFDNVEDLVTIVTPVWPGSGLGAQATYNQACERLADTVADFGRNLPERREVVDSLADLPEPASNMPPARFRAMVERAKEYILAGDIFQVVLSQRFQLPFTLPPFSLYRALRRLNPSPFLFFLDLGSFAIVGSSPEILVRLRDDKVTIRPIAGTRRRGATPAEDRELAAELLADPKERAEHLMLLDLGRNDVGRVAAIGSVEVTEQFTIEHYSHVMHIVSNVEGTIRPASTPSTRSSRASPPARCRARPRCGRCRSSTSWSRSGAGSMPAPSAISRPAARWTPASRCAPPWSRTAPCMSRPAAASSPTASPRRSSRNAAKKPAPWCAPPRRRCGLRRIAGGGTGSLPRPRRLKP
jgi:anthranilate synthase component 1